MNTQLQPLLARRPLLPGESLPSLMERLARANSYEPPSLLLRLLRESERNFNIQLVRPFRASTFERITSLTNINPYNLYKATAHSFTNVLTPPESPFEYLELLNDAFIPLLSRRDAAQHLRPEYKCQFCPFCLKENAYHRLIWLSIACSACLQHKCLLENTCSKCRKIISIGDIIERNCSKCKIDLAEAQTLSVEYDSFGLFTQAIIQSWLSETANPISTIYTLPKQTPRVLFRVLERLQIAVQRVSEGWSFLHQLETLEYCSLPLSNSSQTRILTPYQSYCFYATAFKGFINWPRGFHSFLTAYRNRETQNISNNGNHASGVVEELGTLYESCMQRSRRESSLQFVREAIEQYLIENQISLGSSTLFTSPKKRAKLPTDPRYVSLSEGAVLLKIARERVQLLISAGHLTAYKSGRGDFSITLLEREDILRIREEWDNTINLRKAGDWLGISKEMVVSLVQSGLLIARRDQTEGYAWKFSISSITECLERFAAVIQDYTLKEGAKDEDMMSFDQAFAALVVIGLDKASILQKVAENKLCAYLPMNQKLILGNLLFVRTNIYTYRETVKAEQGWVERNDIARLLQIGPSTVTKIISSGLISRVAACGSKYYFNRDDIEKYKADCITSIEAAKILGIHRKAVLNLVRQKRIPVLYRSPVNDSKCLFSREALLKWRERRITLEEAKRFLGVSTGRIISYVKQGKLAPLEGKSKPWYFSRQAVLEQSID